VKFLSVTSAAGVADCHRQTIGDALRVGDLHGFHAGKNKHWRIDEACLRAWLEGVTCAHRQELAEAA
jgi:hypothetical protein